MGVLLSPGVPEYQGTSNSGKILKINNQGMVQPVVEEQELPEVTSADNGKALIVSQGEWSAENIPVELPSVSSSDNGKVLQVSNGNWSAEELPSGLPNVTSTDNGKILKVASGEWAVGTETTYNEATQSAAGLMSSTDKVKMDNICQFGTSTWVGTGTAGQAGSASVNYIPSLWKFNTGKTPADGDTITIKIPVAGVNAGVWVSVDNGSHYYPVATNTKAILTTHYPVDAHITLVYETGQTTSMYGNSTAGAAAGASKADVVMDRWCVVNYYDSNTTYSNAKLGQGYCTCSTAAATAAKEAALSSYALTTGGIVVVKFTNAVPANATLNINSAGAKAIYYNGSAITAGKINAGETAVFIYSSQYHLIAKATELVNASGVNF